MEKRSRQRVRDQVAHLAFGAETRMRSDARGYPSWPGTQSFRQGPDTEAQDQSPPYRHFWLATRGRSIQMGQIQTSIKGSCWRKADVCRRDLEPQAASTRRL